jgi:short-subunit dehydrogenase
MHVVITGASSGIGAALARELAKPGVRGGPEGCGHSLTLVARRESLLRDLAKTLEVKTHVVAKDLGELETAADWIGAAEDALGPVDVLINNAGVQIVAPTTNVDPDEGERLLKVDLFAPMRLTQAVLPKMIARRSGTIVDVSSLAGMAPTPGMFHYSAAKAALAAASEALRGELRGTGVHVVTVYPGIIETTEMAKTAMEKYEQSWLLSRFPRGNEERLAVLVRRAIERKHDRVIYPRSGLFTRWFPGTTRWMMDRFTPPLRALGA